MSAPAGSDRRKGSYLSFNRRNAAFNYSSFPKGAMEMIL